MVIDISTNDMQARVGGAVYLLSPATKAYSSNVS